LINGLKEKPKSLIFQINSVSKDRLLEKMGKVSNQELNLDIQALNEILKY
jgi:mRNA-degrading endonuclease toxin of MazEF toxin-antitoxin module